MSEAKVGTVGWMDLTVEDADGVRDFYKAVVGWESSPVSMGEYNDYSMGPPGADPVAGVCHARGENVGLPAQWLIYFIVADLDASVAKCLELGGEVIAGPRGESYRFCVVRDPAGAVAALFQAASS